MSNVSVVLATRNRVDALESTLARLLVLPERPPIIVVDNGSDDRTVRGRRHGRDERAHPAPRGRPLAGRLVAASGGRAFMTDDALSSAEEAG